MDKTSKILKIITAATIALASVTMIILAIINLVQNNDGISETVAFRIVACILLILASILSTILVIAKDPHHFNARLVVYNGLLLGAGIFVVLPAASDVADIIVGYLVPCFLIGLGIYFVVAAIVSLINKINSKNTDIISLILGLILLVLGILLLCYAKEATKVMWLIIGVILLATSIIALVNILKKDKKEATVEITNNTNN